MSAPVAPGFVANTNVIAGVSSLAGVPTAVKLQYAPLVSVALAENAINLVDAAAYGHRVKLSMPVTGTTGFQNCFSWERNPGDFYPVGKCDTAKLNAAILAAIKDGYEDLDAQTKGLSFSSSALDSIADPRLRKDEDKSANDLVMAYVLFKLYGRSSYPTIDNVFNLEDAQEMLTDAGLVDEITDSVAANAGDVSQMFKDLIAADPQRFFTAAGQQVTGIFETNAEIAAKVTGSWALVAGDIIEIRVEFTFAEPITRRDAAADQVSTTGLPLETTTVNIDGGHKYAIRLQLTTVAAKPI
jgi:hypothetical protein